MKLKFDPSLQYQHDAVNAVVNVFDGQPYVQTGAMAFQSLQIGGLFQTELGMGNRLMLPDDEILKNVHRIQEANGIEKVPTLEGREFSIEMETGTGKTYVYLRTIFELNKVYGFKKFIIVVPSVAIREGVLKSIEMTKEHFQTLYDKTPFDQFVYDSKRLGKVRQFATSNQIQIMVINIQSFQKDVADKDLADMTEDELKKLNVINRENDRMSGRRPIEFIQAAAPIVIIDEPQSVDTTEKSRRAIRNLNPMATLRYSATHRNPYNLLYKLDPVRAYDLRLVKRIEVASIRSDDNFNDAYIKLVKTDNKNGIKALKPLALLMENVPDILNYGGHNVVEEMVEALSDMGYAARYSLINSSHHGVPQMRDRVYLIAYRKELGIAVRFPKATNWHPLPSGYEGTRSVALKLIDLIGGSGYVEPDLGDDSLPPAVSAGEALEDIPPITLHQEGKLKRGARRFTELARYRGNVALSDYAKSMREWPGFEAGEGVYDHVLRYLPRDTEIFRHMRSGSEYPAALKVANKLFEKEAVKRDLRRDDTEWKELHRRMVPPYPVGSFPNRWWKLNKNGPSRTLMAHIGKDTYSHIHYDSDQARVITPREAARLQSFPDGFVFAGTMNPAFRQIGNAVPPIMAFTMAVVIRDDLKMAAQTFHPQASVAAE